MSERQIAMGKGMGVLDIEKLVGEFVRTGLSSFEKDTAPDRATVQAVAAKGMVLADREEQVRKWLNYYKVTLFFPPEASRKIAQKIIEFADGDRPKALQNKAQIISEYKRLESCLQPLAPPAPKSGKSRAVTSLTSKALWCCYPDDVPIFDDYAVRALQVISRICDIKPESEQSGYESFVDVWFQFYAGVKPVLDQADLNGYPYKIRVLDGLLWYLGKPTFDVSNVDSPPASVEKVIRSDE